MGGALVHVQVYQQSQLPNYVPCKQHLRDPHHGFVAWRRAEGCRIYTEARHAYLCINGVGCSGDVLDFVDMLQGTVRTIRTMWRPDDDAESTGWEVCQDERVEAEWNNWTCSVTGAACNNFSGIYPTDACTALYSDDFDADNDGLCHPGHPWCLWDTW